MQRPYRHSRRDALMQRPYPYSLFSREIYSGLNPKGGKVS